MFKSNKGNKGNKKNGVTSFKNLKNSKEFNSDVRKHISNGITSEFKEVETKLANINKIISDITHLYVEGGEDLNIVQGFKVYVSLRICYRIRRPIKNRYNVLLAMKDANRTSGATVDSIMSTGSDKEKQVNTHILSTYKPRHIVPEDTKETPIFVQVLKAIEKCGLRGIYENDAYISKYDKEYKDGKGE